MKRPLMTAAIAALLFGSMAAAARAEITAEDVRTSIKRGRQYLEGQQHNDGSWPDLLGQTGGVSSLCTLALLNAGAEPDDPHIQKALDFLRKIRPERTYVVSLQTMVFARAEPDRDRLLISRNVKWLEDTQISEGPYQGAWSYPGLGDGDNSNAQFALLALHEAERVGVPAGERTWRMAKNYWEKQQNKLDGSWGYNLRVTGGTGSMTCAGITSLVIAADKIHSSDAKVIGDTIDCCVAQKSNDTDRIERAVQWLGDHFAITSNPGTNGQTWLLYYLYGLERAGRLTARRFIGKHDWYREGADFLVRKQDSLSGFWAGSGHAESEPVIGTSLALLFLSKGRWPVLMSKLKHRQDNDWNQHRADVGNLTRYVESRWKRDMTWQVIDAKLATVDDMLQTPVLYLCGSRSPLPDDRAQAEEFARKLRDYVDRGGFLFAEGYCGGTGFDHGFRELMQMVFPEKEYKLQLLDAAHPIWSAEEKVDPEQLRPLWGVEFGCRTSVVYAPPDPPEKPRASLSCLWELSRSGRGEKYSPVVQAQIDAGMSLGLNVLAYATNRELTEKERFFKPKAADTRADNVERGRLYIATLRHPGGCNAAPRALVNLMDSAGRELRVRPRVRAELLDITDDALFDYHLVFMQGRTAFRLTDGERQRLKSYLERGGMLFADSICASSAFTESFRREMAAIFPDRKLERIPPSDPMLTPAYGGFDLRIVSRRDPETRPAGGGPLQAVVRKAPPDLEGVKFQDRWGVVFSPFDISCALEKRDSLECRGYTREDAARIGLNVVLYSLQQ